MLGGTGLPAGRDDRHSEAAPAEVNRPEAEEPVEALAKAGCYEIASLADVASRRVPVMLDGLRRLGGGAGGSAAVPEGATVPAGEPPLGGGVHARVLELLEQRPLLNLGLRLGEDSGAALAFGLMDAAPAVLHEMTTFTKAGVTDLPRARTHGGEGGVGGG